MSFDGTAKALRTAFPEELEHEIIEAQLHVYETSVGRWFEYEGLQLMTAEPSTGS